MASFDRYDILAPVYLGFLGPQEQYDLYIEAGNGHLEFDGADIYWVALDGKRLCSITTNNAIEIWLQQGFCADKLERLESSAG